MCSDQVQSDPTTKLDILKTHKEVQRESFTQISSFNTDSFSSAGGSDISVNMRKYINIYINMMCCDIFGTFLESTIALS